MSGDPKHPELIPFTFENGVQVWLRKVPPMLINKLNRTFPPPKPPMQDVDYGDGVRQEPNPTHPAHQEALQTYYEDLGERITELLIRVGVKYTLTDENRNELEERRSQLGAMGIELPEDEKLAFICYVCVGSQAESDKLRAAILWRSQPTEEAVQEAVDSFRSDLRGEGPLPDQGSEERSEIQLAPGVGIGASVE